MPLSVWLAVTVIYCMILYIASPSGDEGSRRLRVAEMPPYRRHRVHTGNMQQEIDLEGILQTGFARTGWGNAQSSTTTTSSSSSSSPVDVVDISPDYLQKWGDYSNQLEDTSSSQFLHRDVKNFQMSLLDKVSAAAHDFFASESEHTRDSFIDYLQHALHLSEEERTSISIAADQYLETHLDHKNAIATGEEEAARTRSVGS